MSKAQAARRPGRLKLVMSPYEFRLGPTTRETDSQWKTDLRARNSPPQSDWTRGYLVPGIFTFPGWAY